MTEADLIAVRPKQKGAGGKRPNGRLKKEQIVEMVDQMDAIMPLNNVWAVLAEKVNKGDALAIKTWLAYRLGNPTTRVEATNINVNAGEIPTNKIKAFNNELEEKY
jgi:hypothetical protein